MTPGPLGVPLLGNKHQMPAVKPWVKFTELNKIYGESLVPGSFGCLIILLKRLTALGPVVSLHFGNTPIIGTAVLLLLRLFLDLSFMIFSPCLVLGTAQAAWDLLEKRSDIYSSRPRFVVACVLPFPFYLSLTYLLPLAARFSPIICAVSCFLMETTGENGAR